MTDSRITLDSSKRGGHPCIRNLRTLQKGMEQKSVEFVQQG